MRLLKNMRAVADSYFYGGLWIISSYLLLVDGLLSSSLIQSVSLEYTQTMEKIGIKQVL